MSSSAVDQVLADRSRRAPRAEAASLIAAAVLHGLLVATALLLPHFKPERPPLEFVPVQIIPAQALGVRRPAPPRPRPSPPAAKPAAEEAEPPAPAPPEPEPQKPTPPAPKPADDAPVLPREDTRKKPEPPRPAPSTPTDTRRRPATPPKPTRETPRPDTGRPGTGTGKTGTGTTGKPEDTGDQSGRRGSPTGNPLGTSAFGSEIAGLDNPDFTYGYYTDQLLSRIDQNWVRPSLGEGIRAIIYFRIQRDGSITELAVKETSGFGAFDLAALRAVQNASPFPPLPRAYRNDSLGINLIVR